MLDLSTTETASICLLVFPFQMGEGHFDFLFSLVSFVVVLFCVVDFFLEGREFNKKIIMVNTICRLYHLPSTLYNSFVIIWKPNLNLVPASAPRLI